ncbi:MAG: manganese transporter [Phycisphaerae bacterium]|nr:manganese transporter [Phycisphaerae bacterium]MBM92091.1 manganese transporter [Phycisphaerae bacterium]HCT45046.1 manganese transporter [Phycisphaerales bacterium]
MPTRLIACLMSTLALLGCQLAAPETDEGYTIVTTVGMIQDITVQVATDRAQVTGLMGAGVDPHLYKPTRSDVSRIMSADVVFYNGLLLEGKMVDSLIRAAESGKRVHAVTELIDEDFLLEPAEFEGHYDPHVWMDPTAWAKAVRVVEQNLSEFDPDGASQYQANAQALTEQLEALDAYAERVLSSVPEQQRVLVTAHDAFNYFGRRYGYEVVGIQGLSTESEAGVQDIERLVNLLVERKVGAVFVESTVSERNINALIAGARAKGHEVVIGGELFSDAMGDADTYEGTYIGMIDHNVTTIARALGGEAPERGMNGKLSN